MTQRGRHSGGMYYCKPDKIHNKCKEVDSLGVGSCELNISTAESRAKIWYQ